MIPSLRRWLFNPDRSLDRRQAAAWLTSQGCLPADPAVLARAEELFSLLRAPSTATGGALGVAVWSGEATLLRLHEPAPGLSSDAVFHGTALESMDLARALVLHMAPLVRRLQGSDAAPHFQARWLAWSGSPKRLLDGPSFGLAFALLYAADLMGTQVPPDVLATAALQNDGQLAPVGDLREKVWLTFHYALGVRRLVVHSSQKAEAERVLAEEAGGAWVPEVLGFDDLPSALTNLLGEQLLVTTNPPDLPAIAQEVQELRRQVLRGSSRRLRWSGVAEAATQYRDLLAPDDPTNSALAEQVARIARRHGGHTHDIVLDWPDDAVLRQMSRPQRIRYLAQVLQSGTDESDALARDYLLRALRWLPSFPIENSLEDLQLLGALGRAWAALGEYEQARNSLREAVQGWFDNDEGAQATFALCEYVRVLSLLPEPSERLEEELSYWGRHFESTVDATPRGRAYVRVALARALVTANPGSDEGAAAARARARGWLAPLVDELWLPTGQGLWESARWWLRALPIDDRRRERPALLEKLESTGGEAAEAAALARLDAALEGDGTLEAAITAVLAIPFLRKELTRLGARRPGGLIEDADSWRRMADEYRY